MPTYKVQVEITRRYEKLIDAATPGDAQAEAVKEIGGTEPIASRAWRLTDKRVAVTGWQRATSAMRRAGPAERNA